MHPGRDSWSIKAGSIFLWSKHLRNVNENIAHRAKALESNHRQKGWEREIYGPCQITVLFPRSSSTYWPHTHLQRHRFVQSLFDHSTGSPALISALMAFSNSIPWTHVYPSSRPFFNQPERKRQRESVFETGHSLRMGVISSALPGLSWEKHRCVVPRWLPIHRENYVQSAKLTEKSSHKQNIKFKRTALI